MSRRRLSYLTRRGAVYYLRLPVPPDLQPILGRTEIRKSLDTHCVAEAEPLVKRAAFAFGELCNRLRAMQPPLTIDTNQLIRGFFSKLVTTHVPTKQLPPDASYDWESGDIHGDELYSNMLDKEDYDFTIYRDVRQILAGAGGKLEDIPDLERRQLLEGATRVRRELLRYAAHRRTSLIAPYEVADATLREIGVNLGSPPNQPPPSPAVSAAPEAKPTDTLQDHVYAYFQAKKNVWPQKTANEKRLPLEWFMEMVGPTTDVSDITHVHMLQFKTKMENLRKHTPKGVPLSDTQAKHPNQRVNPKTAKKKFDTVKTFLNWLVKIGVIDKTPGNQLTIEVPKTPKSQQRRGFKPAELDILLSSPLFTGCKNLKFRHKEGDLVRLDDFYWMPLVLLYTGMRMGEPLQIATEDVIITGSAPHFRLDGGKIKLKTASSERNVPIHPDLADFGFLDFVHARQKDDAKTRLFRNIKVPADASGYYSKVIGRYLNRIGLDDPKLVAHSLRHGFKTAQRNAQMPEDIQYFLTGHTMNTSAGDYGEAPEVPVLMSWLQKIDFGISSSVRDRLVTNRKIGPS